MTTFRIKAQKTVGDLESGDFIRIERQYLLVTGITDIIMPNQKAMVGWCNVHVENGTMRTFPMLVVTPLDVYEVDDGAHRD
jgi:hypothetical protein